MTGKEDAKETCNEEAKMTGKEDVKMNGSEETNRSDADGEGAADAAQPDQVTLIGTIERAIEFCKLALDEARSKETTLPHVLVERYGANQDMLRQTKARLVEVIPWRATEPGISYTSMSIMTKKAQVSGQASGHMHITMLSFHPTAFHGSGIYDTDVLDILQIMIQSGIPGHALDVQPSGTGADLSQFAWVMDGSVANSAYAMALLVLAFSILDGVQTNQTSLAAPAPACILEQLGGIATKCPPLAAYFQDSACITFNFSYT